MSIIDKINFILQKSEEYDFDLVENTGTYYKNQKYPKEFEKLKKKALEKLSKKYNVSRNFLMFIGFGDYRDSIGKVQVLFNIEDKKHERYQSTIAINFKMR